MTKYIALINKVLDDDVVSRTKKEFFHSSLYHKEKNCTFSSNDKKLLVSFFRYSLFEKIRLKFSKGNLYIKDGYFFIKSINGFVIVDFSKERICKVLNKEIEPDFPGNEEKAIILFNNISPKILQSYTVDNYNVVIQELIYSEKKFNWNLWGKIMPQIFPLILVPNNKLINYSSKEYLSELVGRLKAVRKLNEYHLGFHDVISKDLIYLLDKYMTCKVEFSYKIFSHGDLTPNNIMVRNNDFVLIDFANAGLLSFTYDLMLLNFYFTKNTTWKKFDKILFKNNTDADVIYGSSKKFFSVFEDVYDVHVSEEEIKFSFILSLTEIFIKSYLRYRSEDEWENGIGMLECVRDICCSIKES